MKLSKALILPVAAVALVVVGTGAVFAATSPSSPASAVDPAANASSPAPTASTAPYLRSVLDGLVAKGTITAAQEQAIIDAWIAKRDELKAERQQLRAFLSDGVLTADELAQLPADSPFQQLKPLMKNGQITVADLRALGLGIMRELRGAGMGRGVGANGQGMGVMRGLLGGGAPAASPSTGG